MSGTKRVNVDFSDSAFTELGRLAKEQNKSMSEVLRDALSLEKWVRDERRRGSKILVERDGVVRELIRPDR